MVVEYKGDIREDTFFDILHEDGMEICGVQVDINPITEGKSGTLESYLPGVEEYLDNKKTDKIKQKSVREKIKVARKKGNLSEKNRENSQKANKDSMHKRGFMDL